MHLFVGVALAVAVAFFVWAASDTFNPMQEWAAHPEAAVWIMTMIKFSVVFWFCVGMLVLPIAVALYIMGPALDLVISLWNRYM